MFGPVLSVITFDDEEEAIEIANNTQSGLAAGVWTQSIGTAFTMAERLEAGLGQHLPGDELPFAVRRLQAFRHRA